MNRYVKRAIRGTTPSVMTASCQFQYSRMAAMPTTITPSRNAEFMPSFRNLSRRLTSFERIDIISPVCLSAKNSMFSRCILSYVSVRMACWMCWAKEFHPQLRVQWNAAPPKNAAAMRPAER
jgi:hypothetical protein